MDTEHPFAELSPEVQEEISYLRYFFEEADFGPAHEDVVQMINADYIKSGGKIPSGYGYEG